MIAARAGCLIPADVAASGTLYPRSSRSTTCRRRSTDRGPARKRSTAFASRGYARSSGLRRPAARRAGHSPDASERRDRDEITRARQYRGNSVVLVLALCTRRHLFAVQGCARSACRRIPATTCAGGRAAARRTLDGGANRSSTWATLRTRSRTSSSGSRREARPVCAALLRRLPKSVYAAARACSGDAGGALTRADRRGAPHAPSAPTRRDGMLEFGPAAAQGRARATCTRSVPRHPAGT